MPSYKAPICVLCKHFDKSADGLICSAFPLGISDELLRSEFDHRNPYPGDKGIQFELALIPTSTGEIVEA
jgi:hypothetical protein